MAFTDGMYDILASEVEAKVGPDPGKPGGGSIEPPELGASGRWDVPARVGPAWVEPARIGSGDGSPNGRLTLRLDPPAESGRLISGDVFAELNLPGTRLRLGGRTDWMLGFVADIGCATRLDNRLIMPCDLTAALPGGASDEVCKGTLDLEVSDAGGIARLHLTVVAETSGGWTFARQVRVDHFPEPPERPEPPRRRIRLYVATTRQANVEYAAAMGLVLSDDHPLGLKRALAAAGIEAEIDRDALAGLPELDIEVTPGEAPSDDEDGGPRKMAYSEYVARVVPRLGAAARKELPDQVDWAHTLVFAAHAAVDDEIGTVLNYGESFGLGSSLSRFNSRNGAALNVTRLATIARDAPGGPHAMDPSVAPDTTTPPMSDDELLAWTVRFTAMHEIAHLLNLPHAWERARGHRFLGASRPEALSWTNYPSRHPFGASAAAYFDSVRSDSAVLVAGVSKGEVLSRRRCVFQKAFQAACDKAEEKDLPHGFDDAELRFIRHAPLPYIAQGGATFLDGDLPEPRLGTPREGSLQLAILVPTAAGPQLAREILLWTWLVQSGGKFVHEFPVVPAWIALLKDGAPVDMAEYFDFRFDSGAVQLLLADATGAAPAALTPAISFSTEGLVGGGRSAGGLRFPWIARKTLFRQMNPVPDALAVQAVFAIDSRLIHSPIVTLRFGGIRQLAHPVDPADLETDASHFVADAVPGGEPPVAVLCDEIAIEFAAYPGAMA